MARNLNPSRMRQRISFGNLSDSTVNNLGVTVAGYQELFSCWYGPYTLNQSQELALQGTTLEGTKTVFIRHTDAVQQVTNARVGSVLYEVVDVNAEEDPGPNSFDLVTLKVVSHNG